MSATRLTYGGLLVLIGALTVHGEVHGQGVPADTSLAALVAEVRAGKSAGARALLSQERGPESRETLDALSDSLVVIALAYRPDGSLDDLRAARAARSTLGMSGSRLSRVPYAGAFDALARLVEASEDVGNQAASLRAMTQLAEQGPVLPYLRGIAVSDSRVAHQAVHLMWQEMGPSGVAALRAFHAMQAVTEPNARLALEFIARREGWDGGPDGVGT